MNNSKKKQIQEIKKTNMRKKGLKSKAERKDKKDEKKFN